MRGGIHDVPLAGLGRRRKCRRDAKSPKGGARILMVKLSTGSKLALVTASLIVSAACAPSLVLACPNEVWAGSNACSSQSYPDLPGMHYSSDPYQSVREVHNGVYGEPQGIKNTPVSNASKAWTVVKMVVRLFGMW